MKLHKSIISALTICGAMLFTCQVASANSNNNVNQSNNTMPKTEQVNNPKNVLSNRIRTNIKQTQYKSNNIRNANLQNNQKLNKTMNKRNESQDSQNNTQGESNYNPIYTFNNNNNHKRNNVNNNILTNKNKNVNQINHQKSSKRKDHKVHYHFNKVHHIQYPDYYTRMAKAPRWHHHKGYAIYKHPFNTINKDSLKPIAFQKKFSRKAIHVVKSAIVDHTHWIKFKSLTSRFVGWINNYATDWTTRWLNVPLISQRPQLPSGCEVTATAMMLRYRDGHKINKMKLAREMPRSSDPYYGFVGSPYSASGWWIAPNGLVPMVNHYTHGRALNMTDWSKGSFIRQINKGIPVVMWLGDIDGFPNHAMTVYGYKISKSHRYDKLFVQDPWYDESRHLSLNYLWYHHAIDPFHYGALSYTK